MVTTFLNELYFKTGDCRVTSTAVATWTHVGMTGGKWNFANKPLPQKTVVTVVTGFTSPGPQFTLEWPESTFFKTSLTFRQRALKMIGREASYEDLFWLAYNEWVAFTFTEGATASPNYNVSLVEVVSPVFKMFVDFDLRTREEPDHMTWGAFVTKLGKTVAEAVVPCYSGSDSSDDMFLVTILTTPAWTSCDNGGYKRGIHVVWPNLLVTKETALKLHCVIELALCSNGPRRDAAKGENPYNQAMDMSVYTTGLRLPGCPKAERCAVCWKNRSKTKNPGRDNCSWSKAHMHNQKLFCPDHLRFPSGYIFRPETVYSIVELIDGSGSRVSLESKKHVILDNDDTGSGYYDMTLRTLASIRTDADTPTPGFDAAERLKRSISIPQSLLSRYNPITETFEDPKKKRTRT
jgi:hypothetical protein